MPEKARVSLKTCKLINIRPQIHHGNFMTEDECYVTIGSEEYRYCRYWQQMISEWPLLAFIYKFCGEFREMQLTQVRNTVLTNTWLRGTLRNYKVQHKAQLPGLYW